MNITQIKSALRFGVISDSNIPKFRATAKGSNIDRTEIFENGPLTGRNCWVAYSGQINIATGVDTFWYDDVLHIFIDIDEL